MHIIFDRSLDWVIQNHAETMKTSLYWNLEWIFILVIQTIEAEEKFTGLGFFVVERKAITAVFGTAVTYCVIVVQGATIFNKKF